MLFKISKTNVYAWSQHISLSYDMLLLIIVAVQSPQTPHDLFVWNQDLVIFQHINATNNCVISARLRVSYEFFFLKSFQYPPSPLSVSCDLPNGIRYQLWSHPNIATQLHPINSISEMAHSRAVGYMYWLALDYTRRNKYIHVKYFKYGILHIWVINNFIAY